MKNIHKLIIETERLLLVPITMNYAEEIFKEFTPEITTYMFPKAAEHISETENFIQEAINKMLAGNNYQAVILDKGSKEFMGCVGLHIKHPTTPELGIWIKKSAFGKQIGREAVAWVSDRAQKNMEFDYLFYPVDQKNIPSRKIAESIWWIVQTNENGEELVHMKATLDANKILHSVEYRIYKK